MSSLTFADFVAPLVGLDGQPLTVEPYRQSIFDRAFQRRADLLATFIHTLILSGRAKKNFKTFDLVLACLFALMDDSPHGNQVYLVANDEGQAGDDLSLAKKIVLANPVLEEWLKMKSNIIERRDGKGFIEILPARDAIGQHGKTYRLLGIDEIHGYKNWDLLEALAPDPTRPDCQQWITSYASLIHRPGAPLFDLLKQARAGADDRMLFSWFAADFCTDEALAELSPEERANPSMTSWGNAEYLAQQQRRLPAHKYRRLHLNLPGLPEGSAFTAETIMDAVERGTASRPREAGIEYHAFVDMSGGSSDDATLAIGHKDADGRAIVDRVMNQGQQPPFDPRQAVVRFVEALRSYGVTRVTGDRYAGETFRSDFRGLGVDYIVAARTTSQNYEALEPHLNGAAVLLPDVALLEQQLLGLIWRGGRIDHPGGEHDDFAASVAGVVGLIMQPGQRGAYMFDCMNGRRLSADGLTYEDAAEHPYDVNWIFD
jgi:hypothetical protein